MSLSQVVEAFANDTEELCGRHSVSLRGALQSQANRFVHRFHDERKNKLRSQRRQICLMWSGLDDDDLLWSHSLLLDNERWKQAEVPAEFQDLVNSIADGRITLPERKIPGNAHLRASSLLTGTHLFREIFTVSADLEERKPAEFLLVDGQKYAVVGYVPHRADRATLGDFTFTRFLFFLRTVLLLIRIFLEYCQCVNDIPSIATDMLTRLSDLLKVGATSVAMNISFRDVPVKLLLCFCSTSIPGAASWSWAPERCRWSD